MGYHLGKKMFIDGYSREIDRKLVTAYAIVKGRDFMEGSSHPHGQHRLQNCTP